MSEQSEEIGVESSGTTVANVQRIERGYFDHMQSLRDRIPVGEYLVKPQTGRLALVAMVMSSLAFLILFPLTMFYQFTPVVVTVYMVAFAAFAWVFYDRVLVPNEGPEEWRD
jgi:fatty acid desaturase